MCQCRRWLAYAAPDRQPEVLKIATYGGTGGGSGEPDRAYDRVVTEVDMERALGMVREPFLRLVGGLHRNLRGERDSRTLAWFRGPLPVIRWLERFEGEPFGPGLVLRGARERLRPILMTALATGLALVPLVIAGNLPGHEIEHPMAVVIVGGLVTSTLLNLFVIPSLYLRFARSGASRVPAEP